MEKSGRRAKVGSSASGIFRERVSGKITSVQYVRALDERASQWRKDEESHRRKK
jgi:hypothetical protein